MIKNKIKELKKKFIYYGIDGYVIPKNDEFFSEYSQIDRLKIISNFSGSAGLAIILKNENYLFVDGRYTIQAKIESGKIFKIISYEKIIDCKLFKNLTLGFDPNLFTANQIKKFFLKHNKTKQIKKNLIDGNYIDSSYQSKPFFSLQKNIVGECHKKKINRLVEYMRKNNSDYIFVTAPENVAWLMNIRGHDSPHSPLPNCRIFVKKNKKIFIIAKKRKLTRLIKEKKINKNQIIEPENFDFFIKNIDKGKIIIDEKTCSLSFQNKLEKKLIISKKKDPIYLLKSIKNKVEIQNMIESHILDGVAVTKFLYWIKRINKKKISEFDAQKKLEKFRKKNKKYLYPSFNTIAGAGPNAAIIHYKAKKETSKIINKNDIFLCDSGAQYKYGTTDVTRTICFSRPKKRVKDIFTRVLKGHIAVVNANIKKNFNGSLIDILARRNLKLKNLNYNHGTGHGVGFFLNVHEGPQSISKFNKIKLVEGMIISNEPGYYEKGNFGIRIENLIYIKKYKKKLFFENLTFVPLEKELIDFNQLTIKEKNYLFFYHLNTYLKISKYLNNSEKKWLASFI